MTFVNNIQTIIRKSNGNILNCYVKDSCLYTREFIYKTGWESPISVIENTKHNDIDMKIDNTDLIYGIANNIEGKMLYLLSDKKSIYSNKLFEYDKDKYLIKYPYIKRHQNAITIAYYLQDQRNTKEWTIALHYFNSEKWSHNHIYSIKAFPIINPFTIINTNDSINVFYFNLISGKEEIFVRRFSKETRSWTNPIQLTSSNNQKLYLNVLKDDLDFYHITWSEFINQNLVIRYLKGNYKKKGFTTNEVKSLSKPANCSFPTFIKTGKALWCIWIQMNSLYSCYSMDQGNTWSKPIIDKKSQDSNFIRYKFSSNYNQDFENFNLNNIFGTSYPVMSFLGFKNIK